jgi:DNA-binding transcriptional regulator YiaG
MEAKKVLTRENKPTGELKRSVEKIFKGTKLTFIEAYYLDCEVDEDTGIINKEKRVRHYTKDQLSRNMKVLKSAYLISKGAVSPNEIIEFRSKYHIAASTLSVILGFSKNTISNIENDGVTSLPSGRLIKMSLNNIDILRSYIKDCDAIDNHKKDELDKNLLQCGV